MKGKTMQSFQILIMETVQVVKLYTVKAPDLQSAFMKAKMGEKEKETTLKDPEVINRELVG